MLDYLYRIKKKKRVNPFMFFFFSINKQHFFPMPFQTKRKFPLSVPFYPPFNPSIKYRLER